MVAYEEYRPTSTLYHYTGSGGFEGMIKSGQLWLSDLRFANDPKELHLAETISDEIGSLSQDTSYTDHERHLFRRVGEHVRRFLKRSGLFSFSLSSKCDRLPMWQEYTDRGTGYCLGFRASAFRHMNLRVQKVRYIPSSDYSKVRDDVLSILSPMIGKPHDDLESVLRVAEIFALATATKNDSWEHEDEVRLIFSGVTRPADFENQEAIPVGILGDGSFEMPSDPEVRTRKNLEIPYFARNFGRLRNKSWDASRAISEIVIGPNNQQKAKDVEDFLKSQGYRDFGVLASECEFRP